MVINQKVKYNSLNDPLDLIFIALADPTRRSILSRLSQRDHTVNELALPYEMSLPAVSKHLRILELAGLISQTKHAQWRPRHLETKSLIRASEWLQNYNMT